MPGDCGHEFSNKDVIKYFATSFEWVFFSCFKNTPDMYVSAYIQSDDDDDDDGCFLRPRLCLKRQVIDLLEEGYTSDQLDSQPVVTVEDWYDVRQMCHWIYVFVRCSCCAYGGGGGCLLTPPQPRAEV